MKPEIKACKECKYYRYEFYDTAAQCSHPEIVASVICGGYEVVDAKTTRHEGKCGIDASIGFPTNLYSPRSKCYLFQVNHDSPILLRGFSSFLLRYTRFMSDVEICSPI